MSAPPPPTPPSTTSMRRWMSSPAVTLLLLHMLLVCMILLAHAPLSPVPSPTSASALSTESRLLAPPERSRRCSNASSSSDASAPDGLVGSLFISTVDGNLYSIDIARGELAWCIHTGKPLLPPSPAYSPTPSSSSSSSSTSSSSSAHPRNPIVPGLDGKLYLSSASGLTPLAHTLPDFVAASIRQHRDGVRFLPRFDTSQLVLDPISGNITAVYGSGMDAGGGGNSSLGMPPPAFHHDANAAANDDAHTAATPPRSSIFVTRNEYALSAIDTTTRTQLWNVSLATYEPSAHTRTLQLSLSELDRCDFPRFAVTPEGVLVSLDDACDRVLWRYALSGPVASLHFIPTDLNQCDEVHAMSCNCVTAVPFVVLDSSSVFATLDPAVDDVEDGASSAASSSSSSSPPSTSTPQGARDDARDLRDAQDPHDAHPLLLAPFGTGSVVASLPVNPRFQPDHHVLQCYRRALEAISHAQCNAYVMQTHGGQLFAVPIGASSADHSSHMLDTPTPSRSPGSQLVPALAGDTKPLAFNPSAPRVHAILPLHPQSDSSLLLHMGYSAWTLPAVPDSRPSLPLPPSTSPSSSGSSGSSASPPSLPSPTDDHHPSDSSTPPPVNGSQRPSGDSSSDLYSLVLIAIFASAFTFAVAVALFLAYMHYAKRRRKSTRQSAGKSQRRHGGGRVGPATSPSTSVPAGEERDDDGGDQGQSGDDDDEDGDEDEDESDDEVKNGEAADSTVSAEAVDANGGRNDAAGAAAKPAKSQRKGTKKQRAVQVTAVDAPVDADADVADVAADSADAVRAAAQAATAVSTPAPSNPASSTSTANGALSQSDASSDAPRDDAPSTPSPAPAGTATVPSATLAPTENALAVHVAPSSPSLNPSSNGDAPSTPSSFSTTPSASASSPPRVNGGSLTDVVSTLTQSVHTLNRMQVFKDVLGLGSNGTTVHPGLLESRPCAVKKLYKMYFDLKDARKEIDLLIRSDEHPNVVRYYAMEEDETCFYLALELCKTSLHKLIAERSSQAMSTATILSILRQMMNGIAYLHSINIVHRDLKPANILLTHSDVCKIADIGMGKQLDPTNSTFDTRVNGSFGWKAPEMMTRDGARLTKFVDIFSAGCIIFNLLTHGGHPFGVDHIRRETNIESNRADLSRLNALPEARDLVALMIAHNPDDRITALDAVNHPLFWSDRRKLDFLLEASDRFELEPAGSELLLTLERTASDVLGGTWNTQLLPELLQDVRKFRKKQYDYASVRDLLRLIRNKARHYGELSDALRLAVGSLASGDEQSSFLQYFLHRFPRLFLHTYAVMSIFCIEPLGSDKCLYSFFPRQFLDIDSSMRGFSSLPLSKLTCVRINSHFRSFYENISVRRLMSLRKSVLVHYRPWFDRSDAWVAGDVNVVTPHGVLYAPDFERVVYATSNEPLPPAPTVVGGGRPHSMAVGGADGGGGGGGGGASALTITELTPVLPVSSASGPRVGSVDRSRAPRNATRAVSPLPKSSTQPSMSQQSATRQQQQQQQPATRQQQQQPLQQQLAKNASRVRIPDAWDEEEEDDKENAEDGTEDGAAEKAVDGDGGNVGDDDDDDDDEHAAAATTATTRKERASSNASWDDDDVDDNDGDVRDEPKQRLAQPQPQRAQPQRAQRAAGPPKSWSNVVVAKSAPSPAHVQRALNR